MASPASIQHWDVDTELLIAGYGLAGACAAIEAHDLAPDARVLIVEKAPEAHAGGNSRVAGQSLLISHNAEALKHYQRAMSRSNPLPEDLLDWWSTEMVALEPWIRARAAEAGAQFIQGTGFSERDAVLEFPEFGARDAVAFTATILPIPSGVWLAFDANVARRPRIQRWFESPIVDLVQDPDTLAVLGAIVLREGRRCAVRAHRGVVLATGGFEANLDMQRNYCGYAEAWPLGTPHNTGDGIGLAQRAGASLWHMRNAGQSGGIWPGIKVPEFDTAFLRTFFWQSFSWLEIAADNQRFYNETAELQLTHYKEKLYGHWVDTPHHRAGPVHMLFDELTRRHNRLITTVMSWNPVVLNYEWSEDNQVEIERGWILRADSIKALAELMERDPVAVAHSVSEYNQACASGEDRRFGRRPDTLMPLAEPPYYAVRMAPAIVCTSGGARRNQYSQVLDQALRPIPGLYEAGELGSMISDLYQNGSYLTEAMISGRAAARHALR